MGSTTITTGGARTAITAFIGGVARSWFTRALAATTAIPGGIVMTTVNYVYDGLYRLTDADYSDGSSFGYAYDAVGNRLTQTTCSGAGCTPTTVTSTYDDANRLATVNGVSFTWDAAGNLLNDGVRTYTYDGANRLTTLSGAGLSQSFAYNGNGDRVSQVTGGVTTTYTLDLNGPLTQVLADGASTYLYGYSRLGEQRAAGWAYHQADALGSVRQLTTATATVSLSRQYDPYGQVMASVGTGTTAFGFTGEQTDASGLVYLGRIENSDNIPP